MIMTRTNAITAAVAAAAALTATGITYAAAAPEAQVSVTPVAVQQAPAQAPMGGDTGNNDHDKGDKGGKEDHDHGRKHHDRGYIQINDRVYSPRSTGCMALINGLGSTNFEILNESHRTVEVFRGVTCDNGAPLATVGPYSTGGVIPGRTEGVKVKHGVVGSFRVVDDRYGDDKGDY